PRGRARRVRGAQGLLRRRRRAHLPAAQPAHREARGGVARARPPRPPLLPPRARRQGCPHPRAGILMNTRSAGGHAEARAAKFLEEKYGYKVLVKNFRSRLGEIDLIAEEAGVLVFIEVRSRTTSRYGEALET